MAYPNLTIERRPSGSKLVHIEIPDAITTPEDFARAVEEVGQALTGDQLVFLNGRAPVWGYAMLVHAAHATPAVGVFEPRRVGYVIVATHDARYRTGQFVPESDV